MPALSPSLLPSPLLLLPRQDRTTPTATSSAPEIANSSAERFLPSASSTGDAGTHPDQGNGDTRAGLWKYAIVIILAVSALFLTVRLLFIYRLRKARLLAFQEQQNLLHQRRQDRADAERARRAWSGAGGDSRRDSFDSLEEPPWERGRGQSGFDGLAGARMRGHEPPPPGYEETVAPPAAAPPPPLGPQHRPSLFKRLFSSTSSILPHTASSFSPSTPSSNPPTSSNLQPLSSSSRSADNNNPSSSSFPSSNITRSRASVEAEAVRRALADAGLLVPPSLALRGSRRLSSTATSPPPPSGSSPALSPDDFEAAARRERRERRERRRERRRRRREQEEEGFGLPTYSKERGEGEEVLQRGEGLKSDEEEGSSDESGSEREEEGGGRRRASTSAGAGGAGGGGEGGESAGPARGASPMRPPPSSS